MSNLLIRPKFKAFGVFLKTAESNAELLFSGSEEDCEKTAKNNTANKEAVLYRTKDMRFLYIYESDNDRYIENSIGMVGYYIYDSDGKMLDGGEYEYLEEKTPYLELAYIILSGEDEGFSPIVKEYSFSEISVPDENLFSSENDIEWETPADTLYLV